MFGRLMTEFEPLFRWHDQMSRMVDGMFNQSPAGRGYSTSYPALNVWEDADGHNAYVEAELPGMSMDELEVTVLGNQLRIAGQRRIGPKNENDTDAGDKGVNWLHRERAQGEFAKEVTLPWSIDADKVEAHLRDGVLTVTLPKTEAAKPKKVKLLTA